MFYFWKKKEEVERLANSLLENEITLEDVQKLLEHKNYFVTAVSNALAMAFLAYTLFNTYDLWKIVVVFFISFLTTLQGFYSSEKLKMQLLGKIVTVASTSTDRIYAVSRAVSEALADGRITPEEVARILSAIAKAGNNPGNHKKGEIKIKAK